LFVFSYMVSVVSFFVNARYRLPVIPFLLPFAGYTLVFLFRERRLAWILPAVGLILLFGLAVNLNLTGFTGTSLAESYHTQGAGYLRNRMYQQAALEFHRALSINPYYVRSMDGLAQAYYEQNSVDKAIELWEKAASLEPDNMRLHFHLGIAYRTRGRLDEAIAQWEEAVRLQPDAPRIYLELGNAYEDKGAYEQASGAYQRAIQADPRYVFARCNLGRLYAKLGRTDDAVKQYKEAIEAQPDFADAYNSLALLYLQEETNLAEGIQLARKALELDGNVGTYWATLAELYFKKGELEKARGIFRQMIAREPEETYWRRRLEELGG
jgi:pentatricopeptide repeat protein